MAQEELQKQAGSMVRPVPKEPRKFRVIILNDDFTTFEFVIEIMITVFGNDLSFVACLAETTHIHNKATVGKYSLDIARSKVAKATSIAREEGYPLKFEIQPE